MKNKIQILVIVFALFFGLMGISHAYTLTGDELKQINSQKVTISNAESYGLRSYYTQLSKWYDILQANDRLGTISKELRDYTYSLIDSRKKVAKQSSLASKSEFLNEYKDNISIEEDFPEDKCTGRYNTIDNISFANDFPTALTIAVRYRESTCGYYLPSNGDGPFQIVNKDYGTGEITEEIFKQTIQDFMDFSKRKIDNYNKRSDEEYPEIRLSYTGFDFTGVVNYLALYNGGTRTGGIIQPNAPEYIYDGYGEEYSGAKKYGTYPMFLKVLEREIDNM